MSGDHVCPWWLAYTFDNPLRRLIHNPEKILSGYVKEAMTVMDIGCGMGYFTLGLAELVGDAGQVIAVDLQQRMLDIMLKRATKKGLAHRIIPHRAGLTSIGVTTPVDFVLAFWMVHEVPDPSIFFKEVVATLKPAGKLVYAEPSFHVPEKQFNEICTSAHKTGLKKTKDLNIAFSRATLFTH